MNTKNMNTITERRTAVAIFALAALMVLPTTVFAHGGEEHVIGVVTSISPTSVTVKTAAAKPVEVGFDAKTTFAQAKKPIQRSDIKVGDRIVIHAVEVNEKLVAHTVEIGAASTSKR